MALSFEEVNVLGNLINDTFGKPSTQGVCSLKTMEVT
jgi:hypothetical protein